MGVLDSLSPISIGGGASKERTKTDTQRQLEREVETGKRPTRQFMQAFWCKQLYESVWHEPIWYGSWHGKRWFA